MFIKQNKLDIGIVKWLSELGHYFREKNVVGSNPTGHLTSIKDSFFTKFKLTCQSKPLVTDYYLVSPANTSEAPQS